MGTGPGLEDRRQVQNKAVAGAKQFIWVTRPLGDLRVPLD